MRSHEKNSKEKKITPEWLPFTFGNKTKILDPLWSPNNLKPGHCNWKIKDENLVILQKGKIPIKRTRKMVFYCTELRSPKIIITTITRITVHRRTQTPFSDSFPVLLQRLQNWIVKYIKQSSP